MNKSGKLNSETYFDGNRVTDNTFNSLEDYREEKDQKKIRLIC